MLTYPGLLFSLSLFTVLTFSYCIQEVSIHTLTKDGSNVDGSIHPGMGGEGGSSLMRSASLRSSVAAYPVPRARGTERERARARERERGAGVHFWVKDYAHSAFACVCVWHDMI